MTGPEHYREAERLLAESRTELRPNDEGHCEADRTIAEAQVYATLAAAPAAITDAELAELAALRGFVRQVRMIAQYGDMSTTARQELTDALAELRKGGADRG
ncbi:hypothetical protein [Streptomyces sp. NPDC005970]|uniref:hypothetical protein n=1 Tax=Streptomyces sp. NPDC005970 TaxID=3156723 RepID=UPI00340D7BCE